MTAGLKGIPVEDPALLLKMQEMTMLMLDEAEMPYLEEE